MSETRVERYCPCVKWFQKEEQKLQISNPMPTSGPIGKTAENRKRERLRRQDEVEIPDPENPECPPCGPRPRWLPQDDGSPVYKRRKRLYCKTGFHIAICPNGTVRGTTDATDPCTLLEFSSAEQGGEVQIRGVESNLYLAMDRKGKLYGESNRYEEGTVWIELLHGLHTSYLNRKYAHMGWYMAIKKSGKAKKAKKTIWGQKAVKFISNEELLRIRDDGLSMILDQILPDAEEWPVQKLKEKEKEFLPDLEIRRATKNYPPLAKDPYRSIGLVTTTIPLNQRLVDDHTWTNVEKVPKWNANVKSCKILKVIDNDTRVIYIESTAKAFGMVAPRDFVMISARKRLDEKRVIQLLLPVQSSEWPEVPGCVRGELGPSAVIFEAVDEESTILVRLYNDDYQIPVFLYPFFARKINESAIQDALNLVRYFRNEEIVNIDVKLPSWMIKSPGRI
ncbi:unnamed protein product [Cyprideis torosa]|uniref:Fibroblast growth factor n=1 Tax=Cyprideis torosa TaxID=163714 RepID=A0A7R8ZK95_9CRUS|nr:unnamed protein product [Cyprideis torosa]CAG0888803.1 unnamed protein product [Cyprideis torosa]